MRRAFAAELRGENAKPWPWADFTTEAEVSAPRLGKHAIVLSGASGEALAFGPAWLANTPQPGDEGTSVIAAHRDTHFRWLKDVRPGDEIEVTRRDGKILTFKAAEGRVVPWDQSGIDPTAQGRHLVIASLHRGGRPRRRDADRRASRDKHKPVIQGRAGLKPTCHSATLFETSDGMDDEENSGN
jgi:sortase A